MSHRTRSGLFVIRSFLLITFGFGLYAGALLIFGEPSTTSQTQPATIPGRCFIGFLTLPTLLFFLLSILAIARSIQDMTARTAIPEPAKPAEPTSPKKNESPVAPAATPVQSNRSAFEAHLEKVRQQREYWLQRKQERDRLRAENFEKKFGSQKP